MEYLFWRRKNPPVSSDLKPPLATCKGIVWVPQIENGSIFIVLREHPLIMSDSREGGGSKMTQKIGH